MMSLARDVLGMGVNDKGEDLSVVAELVKQNTGLKRQSNGREIEMMKMNLELDDAYHSLDDQQNDMQGEIDDLQVELQTQRHSSSRILDKLIKMAESWLAMGAEADRQRSMARSLQKQSDRQRDHINQIKRALKDKNGQISDYQNEIDYKDETISDYVDRYGELCVEAEAAEEEQGTDRRHTWFRTDDSWRCPQCNTEHDGPVTILYLDIDDEDLAVGRNTGTQQDSGDADMRELATRMLNMNIVGKSVEYYMIADLLKKNEDLARGTNNGELERLRTELAAERERALRAEEEASELAEELRVKEDDAVWASDRIAELEVLSDRHRENINGLQRSLENKKALINDYEDRYGYIW
ncbi:hypothetical protein GGI04_001307 [Coemansia thaxteri]|nr:hypothetical protein GGI04_001307 [Coemansia thaxteri]